MKPQPSWYESALYLQLEDVCQHGLNLFITCHSIMQTRRIPGKSFVWTRSLHTPPFSNSSSIHHPLCCESSSPTFQKASSAKIPQLSPANLSTSSQSYAAITSSSLSISYTAPPSASAALSSGSNPSTTTPTVQDGSSPTTTSVVVPWTNVDWFPPMSSTTAAAIVAATIVPVVLILFGVLLLSRYLKRRGPVKSSELAVAPQPQSAIHSNGWATNYHTATGRGCGLSVQTSATEALAVREQQISSVDSSSLRNVPQGIHVRHFGDLSFLLDGSEYSDSSGERGYDDNSSTVELVDDHQLSVSEELVEHQAHYYIPFSVLGLTSIGQEFVELNEKFGLQV